MCINDACHLFSCLRWETSGVVPSAALSAAFSSFASRVLDEDDVMSVLWMRRSDIFCSFRGFQLQQTNTCQNTARNCVTSVLGLSAVAMRSFQIDFKMLLITSSPHESLIQHTVHYWAINTFYSLLSAAKPPVSVSKPFLSIISGNFSLWWRLHSWIACQLTLTTPKQLIVFEYVSAQICGRAAQNRATEHKTKVCVLFFRSAVGWAVSFFFSCSVHINSAIIQLVSTFHIVSLQVWDIHQHTSDLSL